MSEIGRVELPDDTFYHLRCDGEEVLFGTQEDAVEYLSDRAADIDIGDADVQLAQVTTGDEWEIEPVAWQNIALQLLQ